MELYSPSFHSVNPKTHQEINERLRRRYLDRLRQKVKKLRKLLVERDWEILKAECIQLASSGMTYGFRELTQLAIATEQAIPYGRVSRAMTPLSVKERAETLISAMDSVLIENSTL